MLWIFKIFAVPVLVALATLVIRRWGAAVGGLLMGLPLMTGPISAFLAIDEGVAFAAAATVGILLAVAAMGPYVLVFYLTAPRVHWLICLAASMAAFVAAGWGLQMLPVDLRQAAALAAASLLLALLLIPRASAPPRAPAPPWWDIPFRMAVTAALVMLVTLLADSLGPRLSGIVASVPIISSVVLTFTLQQAGPATARAMMRAIALSLLAFAAFFLVVGETIGTLGIGMGYAIAVAITMILSLSLALLDRWLAPNAESRSPSITKALE